MGIGLLCFFLFFLSSCGSGPQEVLHKNSICLNIEQDPNDLDPRKATSVVDRNLVSLLGEGLTRYNEEGKCILALAKDVFVTEDRLCYTFHLKEAYWSNGDKIVAKDFLYAWQTALSPDFPSANAYHLFCMKNGKEIKEGKMDPDQLGAYSIGEDILQISLHSPIPYFLELLSFPIFFPVHRLSSVESISCGPFLLKEWKHHNFIEFIKNPTYVEAHDVHLDRIYMTMVEEETAFQMWERGDLDMVGSPLSSLPHDRIKQLKEEHILQESPLLGTRFLSINTESSLLKNAHIRRALSLAIHREEMIRHLLQGNQKVALRYVPMSQEIYFSDGDGDKAKKYWDLGMEEMGNTDCNCITLLCAASQKNHLIAQVLQQDWKKNLGIDVHIEMNEMKVFFHRMNAKDYHIALSSWVADYNDGENFLEVFQHRTNGMNRTGWENNQYREILSLSKGMTGKERQDALSYCEEILMKEMPVIPLYHLCGHYVKNSSLPHVVFTPVGDVNFRYMEKNDRR